ncbi:hypothetical protein [Variovorax sp. JS1663]|uniref:hypothetical protein n=1 Tax=Variovorax sp. JS1663 TaxID=1851577 RepID=UPI000B349214|nr:hypothetical protein [Variovorax sp. JS1663]OUM00328.1 hypothetical protein A8M77_21855 [Variovorax sp. JS1663]
MPKSSVKKNPKNDKTKNRFVVDLGGLDLSEADRRSVAAAIQGAVLAHLAAKHPLPPKPVQMLDSGGIAGMFIPDPEPDPGPGNYK